MSIHINTNSNDKEKLKGRKPTTAERINYTSPDGQVVVVTKESTAKRWPRHKYPVVCIRLTAKKGTRIQQLPHDEGVEILLTHREVSRHLRALNEADPKAKYSWVEVPEKSAARKAFWALKNQERHG